MKDHSKTKDEYAYSPFVEHLGIELIKESNKEVLLKLTIKNNHLNTNNVLHGGVNATMLDIILGMAVRNATGAKCVTINLNISYLATISKDDEIFAVGRVINEGYKIVTAEGEVYTDNNKIVSKGVGTFKLIR